MARLLGQLRCRACRHVFWPERDQATARFVPCPACTALHVNPAAEGATLPEVASAPHFVQWLRAFWVGPPPRHGYASPLPGLERVDTATIEAFAGCVTWNRLGTPPHVQHSSFVLVAARPPSSASRPRVGDTLWWQEGGASRFVVGQLTPDAAWAELKQLVEDVREAGGAPTLPLDEVADPTPIEREAPSLARDEEAERRLESITVSCGSCGAPAHPSNLAAGARCPYCAAQVALPADLDRALRVYHARIAAAHRVARSPTMMGLGDARWTEELAAGEVAMACVRCGAPNRHRPGAIGEACLSCRAPLIPSTEAQRRATDRAGRLAEEAHRRRGGARARVDVARNEQLRETERALVIAIAIGLVALSVGAIVAVVAYDNPMFLIWAVMGWLGLGAMVLTTTLTRRRLTRRWRPRFAALAEQLASEVGGPSSLAAWAERWWPDRLAPWWLHDGPAFGVVEAVVEGFPVVVGARAQSTVSPLKRPPRTFAMALLAAALPRDAAYWLAQPEAQQCVRALEERGYAVEARLGGLAAQAQVAGMGRLVSTPDTLMELAFVAFTLARLAHLLRAEPHPAPGPDGPARQAR